MYSPHLLSCFINNQLQSWLLMVSQITSYIHTLLMPACNSLVLLLNANSTKKILYTPDFNIRLTDYSVGG